MGSSVQAFTIAASSSSGVDLCFMMVITCFASGLSSSTFLTERGPVITVDEFKHQATTYFLSFRLIVGVTHNLVTPRLLFFRSYASALWKASDQADSFLLH